MKYIFFLILYIYCFHAFSQTIKIDTLRLDTNSDNYKSSYLLFPLINSGNSKIDSSITAKILRGIVGESDYKISIDESLYSWASDIMQDLNFDISLNNDSILSIEFSAEGCGAYCTQSHYYFNFNTKNGKSINIFSIIDSTSNFKKIVQDEKLRYFIAEKKMLQQSLKENEIDIDTYNWALEYLTQWYTTVKFDEFRLFNDRIEVMDNCYYPHAIAGLAPVVVLKYYFKDIDAFLLKSKNP